MTASGPLIGTGHDLEQFAGDVLRSSIPSRRHVDLTRVGLGVCDELGNRRDRHRWMDLQNVERARDACDRRDILDEIEVELVIERRVDRVRRCDQKQRVAVGGRTGVSPMRLVSKKANSTSFVKGSTSIPTRKGVVNRITRDIKAGMINSAIEHGRDGKGTDGLKGFCAFLLENDLRAYAMIFGRMLPLQVNGDITVSPVSLVLSQVPHDRYLSAEEVKRRTPSYRLNDGEPPLVIDNDARPPEIKEPLIEDGAA